MHVIVANGQELMCNDICEVLMVKVQGQELSVDAYTLPFGSYDLILGT